MLPSRLRLTIALNVRRFARVTPADTRLPYPRVRASSRLNSRLFTVFPCSHVAPMCLHQQALTRPVGAWGTNYRLRPVLATKLLTALVAGNVAVLCANSVQVIGGYNLVVLRVAAEMRAGYLGSGSLW